jgi:hypothetical protein
MAAAGAMTLPAAMTRSPGIVTRRRGGRGRSGTAVRVLCENEAAEIQNEDQRQDYPYLFHMPPALDMRDILWFGGTLREPRLKLNR